MTLLMLAGLQIFVPLQWSRFGLWLLAILAGGGAAERLPLRREVGAVLARLMVTPLIAFLR